MRKRQGGVRLYGPYQHRGKWRLVRRERGKADSVRAYDTEAEALEVLAEFRGLVEGKTVMQAIDAWCADLKRRERSQALRVFTEGSLYRITRVKETGDMLLASITPRRARAMYEAMIGRFSVATHRAALKRARSWFTWLIKEGWARTNPFADVEGVGKAKRGKPQLRVTSARLLVDHCVAVAQDNLAAPAALCALLLGMRSGEIVGLRGEDVDDGGRLLWIGDGKTETARRQLEVPDLLAAHLVRLAGTAGQLGRLFPHDDGWLTRRLHKLCSDAGVERVCAHGLRGTHSTLAIRGGTSAHLVMGALDEVARSLGQASTKITTDHYVRPEAMEAAASTAVLRVINGGRG